MRDIYGRFCFMMAASGLKESEIFQLIKDLCDASPDRVMDDIYRVRRLMRSHEVVSDSREYSSSRRSAPFEVEEKIFSLLIEDANLSRAAAAKILGQAIEERRRDAVVPSLGKTSFLDWLSKVKKIVPPSELLYLATNIRNSYVHDAKGDWELK